MQTFRELRITCNAEFSSKLAAALDAALTDGWTRATEAEKRRPGFKEQECFYYSCDKRKGREAALVAIYRRDVESLYVSNVVPTELSELSIEQYNLILKDFHDAILRKIEVHFPVLMIFASGQFRL